MNIAVLFVPLLFLATAVDSQNSTTNGTSLQWSIGGTVQQQPQGSNFSQSASLSSGVFSYTVGPLEGNSANSATTTTPSPGTTTARTTTWTTIIGTVQTNATTTTVTSTTTTTRVTTTTVASTTARGNGNSSSAASGSAVLESIGYNLVLVLNAVCILLQFYVSLFGRRMRLNGLRWFTLYYNLWNIYQVIVISDTASISPWKGWLQDTRFVQNQTDLELLTMSAFPFGVILLVPLMLLSHFCLCCPLRWLPWIPLYVVLFLAGTLLYNGGLNLSLPVAKGNATFQLGNGTAPIDVFETYAFVSISLAAVSALYAIPMMFAGVFFFLCYRLFNRYNPKSNHELRASRIVDLVLLVPFLLVVLAVHLPSFIVNLQGYFLVNIWPRIQTQVLALLAGSGSSSGGGGGGGGGGMNMQLMMQILNYYNQIVLYKETTEIVIPLVEFLASFLFIRMYREQYLALLSCYACYKGDSEGAFGLCCPCAGRSAKKQLVPAQAVAAVAPFPMAQQLPMDPRLWAQPVVKYQ